MRASPRREQNPSSFAAPAAAAQPVSTGSTLPPAVILGGDANALSVARSLSRLGARVYYIGEGGECARHSRHCRAIDLSKGAAEDGWEMAVVRYLLSHNADHLAGAVVLACSDSGLELLIRHGGSLRGRFRLDESDPVAQMTMLDKLKTYRLASEAGVATPKFWIAHSRDELDTIREELVYPLIVKPRLAHRAKKQFKTKHHVVNDFASLVEAFDAECDAAVEVVLMEEIPGGDDTLCSYYTYMDERGEALFDFTKRVIRRYPVGMGLGCYHVTDRVDVIIEPSRKLLREAGLRGLAAVEFKRDPRDGVPKLIECNARFTAANGLVAASGVDIAAFVYRRAAGLPPQAMNGFKVGLHVWDPVVDVLSFLQMRRMGTLGVFGWIRSLMHQQTFAFFRLTDPLPAVARGSKMVSMLLRSKNSPAKREQPVNSVDIAAVPASTRDELMASESDAEVAVA
jgi:predicted ATP-grasp superfamily ATP-dependent carboligase